MKREKERQNTCKRKKKMGSNKQTESQTGHFILLLCFFSLSFSVLVLVCLFVLSSSSFFLCSFSLLCIPFSFIFLFAFYCFVIFFFLFLFLFDLLPPLLPLHPHLFLSCSLHCSFCFFLFCLPLCSLSIRLFSSPLFFCRSALLLHPVLFPVGFCPFFSSLQPSSHVPLRLIPPLLPLPSSFCFCPFRFSFLPGFSIPLLPLVLHPPDLSHYVLSPFLVHVFFFDSLFKESDRESKRMPRQRTRQQKLRIRMRQKKTMGQAANNTSRQRDEGGSMIQKTGRPKCICHCLGGAEGLCQLCLSLFLGRRRLPFPFVILILWTTGFHSSSSCSDVFKSFIFLFIIIIVNSTSRGGRNWSRRRR